MALGLFRSEEREVTKLQVWLHAAPDKASRLCALSPPCAAWHVCQPSPPLAAGAAPRGRARDMDGLIGVCGGGGVGCCCSVCHMPQPFTWHFHVQVVSAVLVGTSTS